MAKLVAHIDTATESRHFWGMPGGGQSDGRVRMKPASRLEIVQSEKEVFLYRYDSEGGFAGDTWHMSMEEAKEQARFEYPDAVLEWREGE
jgi:hypothetical protein